MGYLFMGCILDGPMMKMCAFARTNVFVLYNIIHLNAAQLYAIARLSGSLVERLRIWP